MSIYLPLNKKMKHVILFISAIVLLSISSWSTKATLFIPSKKSVEIDYPDFEQFMITLKNGPTTQIEVAVVNKESGEQVKGFGLNKMGKADLSVEKENKLVLTNNSGKDAYMEYSIWEPKKQEQPAAEYINFTLRNNTAKSIPLIIPTVMNPNLSPFSNSGVGLKIGQEIFFKHQGKKVLLLVVSNDIKEGEVLDVAALIKEKKKQL